MFCNPCSASSAILPNASSSKEERYTVTDDAGFDEKFEFPSERSLNSSLRLKIKPTQIGRKNGDSNASQAHQQHKLLEQEMFLLSSELCWKSGNIHDYQHQLLTSTLHSFIYYECGQQIMTSVQIKSPLIIVLRNTVQGIPIAYNTQNVWILLMRALHSFNRLIQDYEKQNSSIFPQHHPPSSANSNIAISTDLFTQQGWNGAFSSSSTFTSIEHIFMMADILIAAFVNNFDDSMELNSSKDKPSLIREVNQLLLHLNNILLVVPEDSRRTCAISFSQMMIKQSQFLMILLKHLEQSCVTFNLTTSSASSFSSFLHHVHETINLFPLINQTMNYLKVQCGEESLHYYININLIYLLYEYYLSFLIQLEVIVNADPLYKTSLKLLQNKLITCLLQILPTSQEILSEMKRMEQYYLNHLSGGLPPSMRNNHSHVIHNNGAGGKSGYKLASVHQKDDTNLSNWIKHLLGRDSFLRPFSPASPPQTPPAVQQHKKIEGNTNDGGTELLKPSEFIFTFRFRHLLLGLLKYVTLYVPTTLSPTAHSPAHLSIIQKSNFPNKEETFILLYEIFSYLLPFGPHQEMLMAVNGNSSSNQTNDLMRCLPFLTYQMLKLSFAVKRDHSVRWIFWSLAQKLLKFNEKLRLYFNSLMNITLVDVNSLQDYSIAGGNSLHSNHHLHNDSENHIPISALASPTFTTPKRRVSYNNSNMKALTDNQNIHRPNSSNPLSMTFSPLDIAMETPFKELNGENAFSSTKQGESQKRKFSTDNSRNGSHASGFKIDDLVDGLCILPNGSKRWFPGKIVEVIPRLQGEFLYTVLFNDGEMGKEKSKEEIRLTKNRARKAPPTKNNNDNSKSNSETAPKVQNPAESSNAPSAEVAAESHSAVKSHSAQKVPELNIRTELPADNTASHTSLNASLNSPELLLSPGTEKSISPLPPVRNPKAQAVSALQIKKEMAADDFLQSSESLLAKRLEESDLNSFSMSFVKQVDEFDVDEQGNHRRISGGERVDDEDEDLQNTSGEESEEDRIYEIPSIFDNHHRQQVNKRHIEEVVPRMQFTNLPISSALPAISASPSLSSSLLAETTPSDASSFFPSMNSGRELHAPASGRKYSARSQGGGGSSVATATAGISFYKNGHSNSGMGTSRSHYLVTQRSGVGLTQRSEFDDPSMVPNSSRSLPHGKRTPNRRRSLSNTGGELVSASVNAASSMHSMSREVFLQRGAGNMIGAAATVLSSGYNSVRSTPVPEIYDRLPTSTYYWLAQPEHLDVLLETFTTIVMMLLVYSFHEESGDLDYNCCFHHPDMNTVAEDLPIHTITQRLSSKSVDSTDSTSMSFLRKDGGGGLKGGVSVSEAADITMMNCIYIIREFMELTFPSSQAHLVSSTGITNPYASPMSGALRSPVSGIMANFHSPPTGLVSSSNLSTIAQIQTTVMRTLSQFILYVNPTMEMIRLSKLLHPSYFHQHQNGSSNTKIANYLIPMNKFEKQYSQDPYDTELNKIGEGAFGTVYRLIITNKENKGQNQQNHFNQGHISEEEGGSGRKMISESRRNSSLRGILSPSPSIRSGGNQSVVPRASWDSFYQYSHCFTCYRREHYPSAFDDEDENEDDLEQVTPSNTSSLPLEYSRTYENVTAANLASTTPYTSSAHSNSLRISNNVFCQCWKSQFLTGKNGKQPKKIKRKVFAVKKLMRERSIHDLSMVYNLYQEILCLEKLSECIGICGIEDYGLSNTSQEYIMILENGFMNILEWRQHYLLYKNDIYSFYTQERIPFSSNAFSSSSATILVNHQLPPTAFSPIGKVNVEVTCAPDLTNTVPSFDETTTHYQTNPHKPIATPAFPSPALLRHTGGAGLSMKSYHELLSYYQQYGGKAMEGIMEWDMLLFFHLYYEMLLILQYTHHQKIIHFDIKLANFILRDHPIHHFEYIRYMHSIGKVSGILFLTDFGEAIFNIQQCSNKKILQKSRGTVPIQSPEMLSISESQSHNANNPDRRKKSKGSGTAASGYDRDNDEQESMLMMSENVLQRKPLFLQTPEEIQRTTTFSHYHQSHQINYSPHHANHPNHDQQSITSASTFSQRKTNQIQFPLPDYSSDIWSIGCLFFELLTAEMLFQQQSFPELYTKLCLQPFPPPHQTSSNSSFVIDAMNQFLQKNVQELQQLATSSSSSATVSSSLSLPKEKLNQLFLSILQQNPCQRLALSQIVIEMKDIIDEYSQLTIVKVQTSEKIHQQEEKKKKENNHQNDTKMRNKNDKGKKDYSEPPPRTLSEQPSTHHQVSAQSLFSHESQLFHSTTVQKTQMPPHTKHDSVLTLSHDDEDDYEKRKFGNASVGKQDTFNTMIAEEEEEEKESEGTSSLFVVDLTDEKKALLSRPAPSNAKTTGVQNPASASKRTSLSQLLNAPPIQSHNTDCLRFSQNLFLLPDAQFHELLNALPTLHLLQTMSKQHSVAQNTSLQTSPPKTLNSSSQSWLKPCLELENNNNSYYDSFMTAAPSSSLPDKNGVSNSLSLSVAASLTSLIISPVKKGGSPRKGAATSLDDPIRAIPPIGTHLQSGAIKNNNSLLLQPNYQLFSPNLALEQIFQPHQHRAPPAPSSPHANHDDRHDPSHNSSGQSLNFMDNSQNRLGSGANGMMGHYWMEGIPSLLLKDLLTHYQYYCLEYSYAPPPNMHHLTSLPHSADHSNNITPPPNTSTMTGTTTPPATVKGVEKNHGTAQKQQNTLISQITPYPIIGLYLKYQIMTKEDMKHQGYYHQNSFRPKIHYERHGKLSQIIYYTLYIPIIIDESHSGLTEQEEGAGEGSSSSSLRIELSIDRVIEVLQDFLLIHFIPTYAHPSSSSNASSASSPSSTPKNPKPLVFIFYDDMTKLEEEKELKRVIQLTKEKNNNKEASKLSNNTNNNQKNTMERTKEENKESIDEEEKNEQSDIFHQIQEEKYWIEKKGLIVKMIQEKIIQILNSIKLVLSGFITRYLQEDVTSSAPSISSCGTIESPLSIEHQMGDALQSILQSILTFTRYLCIASSSSSSSMNNMNDNNNGHDSSSDNKNKGNNSTGLTYSMGLIERLLYYFFASLQHDPSHNNNNDSQATGKKYYQKLKNNNHDHNNKDPLVKTSSQLKRLASIRHILLMENNSRTNLSSATSPHNMHSVRRSDEITPEPLQPPHQHIHLRSQAKQRSVFSYLWESASSLSLSRGVSVHMAISGKSVGTNISSRNKNKQRSKKIIRK